MTQRQGKCDRCKLAFGWTINVPLSRQICPGCNGPMQRTTRHCPYPWFTWEGYYPLPFSRTVTKGGTTCLV